MKVLKSKIFIIFLYILAIFGIVGYAVYNQKSETVYPSHGVGGNENGYSVFPKITSVPQGKLEYLTQVPLVITVDDLGGIVPDDNVLNNIAAYYKDYQVALGETSNGFIVMPSSSNYLAFASGNTYSGSTPVKFAWNWDNELYYYTENNPGLNNWNGAVVTNAVPASMPSNHIFKEQLRALYNAGGMDNLKSQWETLINTDTITQSRQMWRAVADTMESGGTTEAVNQYMHLGESGETAYDYNHMSQWTETQSSESFLDTVDIFMTIIASVKTSPRAYEVWKGILNGYLNDGTRSVVNEATLCKYNIIMSPGVAIMDAGNLGHGNQVLVTGSIDFLNWMYQVEDNYSVGHRVINENSTGKAVVLAAETLGSGEPGNDNTNAYFRSAVSSSIASKPLIAANYPFNFGVNVRGYAVAPMLGSALYDINDYNNWDLSDFGHYPVSMRYLNAVSNGVTYYGKSFIIPSPQSDIVTNPALDATFTVIWNEHQNNYFTTSPSSETVGDEAQLRVRFNVAKDSLSAYLDKLEQYSTYYIAFDIVSNNNTVPERFSIKPLEGVTNLNGNPSFKINGSYGLKQRIPVTKEVLRSLLKGETTYNAIIDSATASAGIGPQETQTYGYDLQAFIYYGEEGKGAEYPSSWTGYSYDKDSAAQAKHKVSVQRPTEGIEAEYLEWHSDPEAYAEIKEGYVNYTGTNSVEAFEAMAGVPSTEMLYFASGGSEFIVELQLKLYKGELGIRTYDSVFSGTECEFKHTDAFWPMQGGKTGVYKEKEDADDTEVSAGGTQGQSGQVVTGEMQYAKFYHADEYDNDEGGTNRYSGKKLAQGYKWAIPGNDLTGNNGSNGSVTYQIDLNGHTHTSDHSDPEGDKNMGSSTIIATYTGTIPNKISDHSPEETNSEGNSWFDSYLEANPAPDCQGGFDGYAGHAYMGNNRTKWDSSSLVKALQSARDWAAAYEDTNETYTAFSTADSDGYTRIWRIGKATINVSVGTSGASGSGTNSGNTGAINGNFTTEQLTDAWLNSTITANSEGDAGAAFFGSGHSLHEGSDGTAGEHGDSDGPPPVPHGEDSDGSPTVPSTISQTGTINYTITVTFDNGTFDAHELCGPCCQHDLPWIGDAWAQTFQYDYAALNVCRVYKIHRSYLKGGDLEEITFADYNKENSSEADSHWMYSGPIQNYTIDNGNWSSEGRYPRHAGFRLGTAIGLRNAKRARQLLTAKEQSKRHNGTDTIVAAVNQGDPNIFYGIGMMFNVQDGNNRSYAYEVIQQETMRANKEAVDWHEYSKQTGYAGRVRNSLGAHQMQTLQLWEASQRGDYTNSIGSGYAQINPGSGWTGPFGSRSNKCDGMSYTVGGSNPVKTISNGHAAPTVSFVSNGTRGMTSQETLVSKDNKTITCKPFLGNSADASVIGTGRNAEQPWKTGAIPNYSTGVLYSRAWMTQGIANTAGPNNGKGNIGNIQSQGYKLATDNGGYPGMSGEGYYYNTLDEYWMATLTKSDDYGVSSLAYPGTVETNGGGVYADGQYKYEAQDNLQNPTQKNTAGWAKTGYTYDSIDYFDYKSEEYYRFRFRRNMRNTLYVISDMLILQTSTGDQPVMYHWKSQTKRTQQHYDYVEADVDSKMVAFDSDITNYKILLREEGLDSIWQNQHHSERDETDGYVTRTAAGWGSNNVGTYKAVNVGGYLGLYQQPDRKFSSFVNNDRISTLYDGDPYDSGKAATIMTGNMINNMTGNQGNDTGHRWSSSLRATFNETAVNFPVIWDVHYPRSVANVGPLDFGGNKKETAIWVDEKHTGDNLSYVAEGSGCFREYYSHYQPGPQNLWRYATTVDNLNPDMYKSNAAAHGRNWGEAANQVPAGLRMTRPNAALRIVTDKIQINPVISNGQYDTGEATQTYMKILDYPFVDIGEMNYVDALANGGKRDIFVSDKAGNVNVAASQIDERAKYYTPIFEDVEICITDEDDINENGRHFNDGYFSSYTKNGKKKNGDQMLWNVTNGFEVDAPYSKTHSKINDILIHTPISVENAIITHNQKSVNENWYADTRTGADKLTTVGLNEFVQKLEKCTGDPDTCQFHILECKYGKDTLLFSADFNEAETTSVLNKVNNQKINLPAGFNKVNTITQYKRKSATQFAEVDDPDYKAIDNWTKNQGETDAEFAERKAKAKQDYIDKYEVIQMKDGIWYETYQGGISNISANSGANQYGFTSENKNFLSCFGNRFSIPLSIANDDVIEVDMDFYANWATAGKSMIISFDNFGFVIENPYDNRWGFGLGRTGSQAYITDEYRNNVFNSGAKLKLVFDFGDASQSKIYYNGVEMATKTVINNWPATTPSNKGHLNIGSWDQNNEYPAQFWIDNLTVTKLAKERRHTKACYTYTFEHDKAVEYTCGIQKTIQFNPDVATQTVNGDSIDVNRPYVYTAEEAGIYRVEAWGAAGGGATQQINAASSGGLGGFSNGYIHLAKDESIMIYPGERGNKVDSTGWLYAWTVSNGCYLQGGTDTGLWAQYCKEQGAQGVNWDKLDNVVYINSKTGIEEAPQTLYVLYSATVPPKYTCGAHSISIAMRKNASTGELEMVRKEKGGPGSGGTYTTTIEHRYPYNISPSGTGRYVLSTFKSPMTGQVTFNVETVNWHANWYAIYDGTVGNSSDMTTAGAIASSDNIHLTYDQSKSKVTANLIEGHTYTFCVISKCGLFTARNGAVSGTVILYETQTHTYPPEPINTIAGAGFNGGGSGGVNGYGGGGGTDIRRLSVGGMYTLPGYNGAIATKNVNGTNFALVFDHDLTQGYFGSKEAAKLSNAPGKFSMLSKIDSIKAAGDYHFLLEYPDLDASKYNEWKQKNNPLTDATDSKNTTGVKVDGYQGIHIDWNGNFWGGLTKSTNGTTLLDGSTGHGNWWYAIGVTGKFEDDFKTPGPNSTKVSRVKLWVAVDDTKLKALKPNGAQALMVESADLIYGPYIDLTAGTYQVDIYGTTAKSQMGVSCAQIDVYDNNATNDGRYILFDTTTHGIYDIKRSPTHVSFYFTLKDDHPKVNGGGIEVRLKKVEGAKVADYGFTEMYITKLEDRILVAGGGGGADNGGGTVNGNDDGSGGDGGGQVGGSARVDGALCNGAKLTPDLADSAINKRKDSENRGWTAIDGVARSGCGLGGTQNSGYAFGRGETISYNTDTGGAGGGWYGGYVTNHNNGGAGGGSGYKNQNEVTGGVVSSGANKGQGKVTIQLVEHEHTNATSHAFSYTGNVQTWTVDESGEYLIEAWGAQGGMYTSGYQGGKGAYASNIVNLNKGQTLYIYVGSHGLSYPENSGGKLNPTAQANKNFSYGGAGNGGGGNGGDASDVRLGTAYNTRLVVAAGGGGADLNSRPGIGGELKGGNSNLPSTNGVNGLVQTGVTEARGGTQTSGGRGSDPSSTTYQRADGQLGYGGGKTASINIDGGGGGGGYYGGGSGNNGHSGGAGGSSYVGSSKYARMIDGASRQPGKGMNVQDQIGNSGDGYVRITRVTRGHTEDCKTESTEFNVHLHTIDCLYKDAVDKTDANMNEVLKAALKAEYYGDGSALRTYLGNNVYDALHSSTTYTINGFGPTDTKGFSTKAYDDHMQYGTGILYGDASGILHFVPGVNDNWVCLNGSFPTSINSIKVQVRYPNGVPSKATMFYTTDSSGYSEATALNVTPANTTDWQTLEFKPNFTGTARKLRFDLDNTNAGVAKEIQIKSVTFSGKDFAPDNSIRPSTNSITIDYTKGMPATVAEGSASVITQNNATGLSVKQVGSGYDVKILAEIPKGALKFIRVTFKIPTDSPTTGWSMGWSGKWSETTVPWNYNTNSPGTPVTETKLVSHTTPNVVASSLYQNPQNTHETQTLTWYVGDAFSNMPITELLLDAVSGNAKATVNISKIELIGYVDAGSVVKDNTEHNYSFKNTGIKTKTVGGNTYALVLEHDLTKGYFKSKNDAQDSTAPGRFSILAKMDSIKAAGNYQFRLEYPNLSTTLYNEWTQKNNPIFDTTDSVYSNNGAVNDNYHAVEGYTPIHIDWSGNNFGGLTRSIGGNALLDGTTGSPYWWYAIGATALYQEEYKTPGPNSTVVNKVQLWLKVDPAKVNSLASTLGQMQEFTVPEYEDGTYLLETWGANGGNARVTNTETILQGSGGQGGYTMATKDLNEHDTLYIYVGGKGGDTPSGARSFGAGGWNGGAPGGTELAGETQPENGAGGGGMTHISKSKTDNLSSVGSIVTESMACGDAVAKGDLLGVGAYGYKSTFKADAPSTTTTITTTNTHLTQYIIVDLSMSGTNGFNSAWLTNKRSTEIGNWLAQKLSKTSTVYNGVTGTSSVWSSSTTCWMTNNSLGVYCSEGRHGCGTYTFPVQFQTGHTYALIAYSACGAFTGANGPACTADFTLQKYIMKVAESNTLDTNNFIIGAGGGGGAVSHLNNLSGTKNLGGKGGGASGTTNNTTSTAGTQSSGYKMGIGKAGFSPSSDNRYADAGSNAAIAGGGGGWWGGTSVDSLEPGENAFNSKGGAGAGGSGHINTAQVTNGSTFTGNAKPNPDASGNGFARISKVNPVYIISSGKTQDVVLKYQSALVTDPNDLSYAANKIAQYLSYNTYGSSKPTVPDKIGGWDNPIYSCYNHPLNYHICNENCVYHKVLDCHEPHHEGRHYETLAAAQDAVYYSIKNAEINTVYENAIKANREASKAELDAAVARANAIWAAYDKSQISSCYVPCNDDNNHKHDYDTVDAKETKIGEQYINTDEYFDIYYPNTGDFEENPSLHGISYISNIRGMGYTDDMDTGRFAYPEVSQNYAEESRRPGYTVNWVRERYVKFNFDVLFYRAETGLWEQYLANRWIEIPVEGNEDNIGYAYDTFDKYGHYVTQQGDYVNSPSSNTDNDSVFDKTLYGHPLYHFYCTLNNDEAASTPYVFESEAINSESSPNGKNKYYPKDTYDYNASDYGKSGHGIPVYESITGEFLYKTQQDRYERVVNNKATNKLTPNAIDSNGVPYHINDNDNRTAATNKLRYKNHNADHGATLTRKVDLVGRVGNLMIIYSNDPNYSNLFKRADKTKPAIIEGVVYDIFEGIQRDYLSYHYNNGTLAYDVRQRQVARNTAYYNTWASSLFKGASKSNDYTGEELAAEKQNKDDLSLSVTLNSVGAADEVQLGKDPMSAPVTSGKNNINQLKKYEITRGYELFYELTSTGNYQNRADVKTYFYSLDLRNGAVNPVDVWYVSDNKYLGINFFGAADGLPLTGLTVDGDVLIKTPTGGKTAKITDTTVQKMLNSYDININWKKEADLRMYNHMEKALTEYVAQNVKEYYSDDDKANYYWSDVPDGVEPKPVRIPSGEYFRIGNAQALSVYNKGRSFIGTRYTMYEQFRHKYSSEHQVHETNLFDLVDDLEYIWHAQRWHFKLSLPKSAVFVPVTNGIHHHPTEELTTTEYDANGEKIYYYQLIDHNMQATDSGMVLEKGENDGHYKVFATVNIKTIGTVWNLYYTQAKKVKNSQTAAEAKFLYPDYTYSKNSGDQGVVNIYDVENESTKMYTLDTNFINYTTGKLSDSQVVIAFFVDTNSASTSEDSENEVIATH